MFFFCSGDNSAVVLNCVCFCTKRISTSFESLDDKFVEVVVELEAEAEEEEDSAAEEDEEEV